MTSHETPQCKHSAAPPEFRIQSVSQSNPNNTIHKTRNMTTSAIHAERPWQSHSFEHIPRILHIRKRCHQYDLKFQDTHHLYLLKRAKHLHCQTYPRTKPQSATPCEKTWKHRFPSSKTSAATKSSARNLRNSASLTKASRKATYSASSTTRLTHI